MVWAKSVGPNLTYCKIFENFMGNYLMCMCFWTLKGATKASLLICWQCSAWISMFPVAHPKTDARCSFFIFNFVNRKIAMHNLFNNRTGRHTHTSSSTGRSPILFDISFSNRLKYLIQQVNTSDVFSIFRSKNHFVAFFCTLMICEYTY